MVLCHQHPEVEEVEFVLRPNCSLGWSGMKWVFALVAAPTVIITLYFCALGAWLVVPFAGLELLVVAGALYVAACDARRQEVVSIRGDTVVVQWGQRRPEGEHRLRRGWARVDLREPPCGWHPSRLYLRLHDQAVHIGAALREGERRWLARELQRVLEPPPAPTAPRPAQLPGRRRLGLSL